MFSVFVCKQFVHTYFIPLIFLKCSKELSGNILKTFSFSYELTVESSVIYLAKTSLCNNYSSLTSKTSEVFSVK